VRRFRGRLLHDCPARRFAPHKRFSETPTDSGYMDSSRSPILLPFEALGRAFLGLISEMGRMVLFFATAVLFFFVYPFPWRKVLAQIDFIGARSIFVISLTALSTGMVLGLQGYYALKGYGSEGLLGATVANTLIREMGPVLTAIMITARAGSAMAAEIGVMRISEQIDALETMEINPIRFLVTPRLIAAILCFPLLTAIFDVVGIVGGYLSGSMLLDMNPYLYFYRVESSITMHDVSGGFIKAFFFALVVIVVCSFSGYNTHRRKNAFGARGVSDATTSAVVMSCVLILICDYVLTSFIR
jgi:phospholipid/cholesterol/gamma-HCH transport system permease protein